MNDTKTWAVVAATTLFAAGCGGPECPEGGTGTLDVAIAGLPEGTDADVELVGPGASRQLVVASSRVERTAAGAWQLRARPVAADGGLVRRAFDVPEPVEVCVRRDGETGATLTYAQIPSSAKLWVGAQNSPAPVLGWTADALVTTGSPSPLVQLDSAPQISTGRGIAFDRLGNLWAVDAGNNRVKAYAGSGLGASAERVPSVTLSSSAFGPGLPGPVALAFDSQGNLWVSSAQPKKVARLTAEQLVAGGAQEPGVVLTTVDAPGALAFDAHGNLWVASGDRVLRFDAARLGASQTAADLELTAVDATDVVLGGPTGLAFDAAGNLWVSYFEPNVIARLSPGDLSGEGTRELKPSIQLEVSVSALLDGLVFDELGGLWTPLANGKLGRFAPEQLAASGAASPERTISSAELGAAHGLAVYPAPSGSPLYHRLP